MAQQEEPQTPLILKVEHIDGVEYEVGGQPHSAAVKRRDASDQKRGKDLAQARKDVADARTATAKEKARADSAESKLKTATAAWKQAVDPKRLDHAVKVRAAVISRAQRVLGKDFKADGLTNFQIKQSAAEKAYPELKSRLDAKNHKTPAEHHAYVNAMFRTGTVGEKRGDGKQPRLAVPIPEDLKKHPDEVRADAGGNRGRRGERTLEQVRADRRNDDDDRHRQPLMVSKNSPTKELDGFPALQSSQLETMK